MAKNKVKDPNDISNDKSVRRILNNINNMIGQSNLTLYGSDRTSDVDSLNSKFQTLMNDHMNEITNSDTNDMSSFIGQVLSLDNRNNATAEFLNSQTLNLSQDQFGAMQSVIYDAYRNRLMEQSDIHEVSSQLIELSEAILITRDAIISADVVEGRMSRSLMIDNIDEDEESNTKSIIENVEKKFELLEKIKNFCIPKTLEYGEYYIYIIPYSKMFEEFEMMRQKDNMQGFHESTVFESFDDNISNNTFKSKKNNNDSFDKFINETYDAYCIQESTKYKTDKYNNPESGVISKEDFKKDIKNILNNISVCNESVPIPIIEEGIESFGYIKESTYSYTREESKKEEVDGSDLFSRVTQAKVNEDGIIFENDKKKKKKNEYADIKDCYIRVLDPTKVVPIKIMNTIIGYYVIYEEDITPLAGGVSANLYYTKFDEHRKEATIIDAIAERIVKSFNKSFLEKNAKFKEAIVDCIQYYNLNEKRLKFQFIPVEYIQEFKIDKDENGNGQSMLKKSLFYAKLYLMLLLFKIMSIILYSNDQKVNYIRTSGIDKNIANKVQEQARIKQARQINITDLFSYTTLINKVGNGSEMYIPTGRSGERPIETDILSGQDIQLNTDLLEMLKNAYILGTGVPAAIINYMNEADFAKVIEQNNTKFNGRVVNYQLDFNKDITDMYKKILRWSTDLPENVIENFQFVLQPPKNTATTTKSEIIGNFQQLADFFVSLIYDDPSQSLEAEKLQQEIKIFKKLLAKDQLPMLDFDRAEEIAKEAFTKSLEERMKPKPSNGDNGDDDGLEEDIENI